MVRILFFETRYKCVYCRMSLEHLCLLMCVRECVWLKPAKDDISGWCSLCFGRLNVLRPRDAINETDDVTCSDSELSDTATGRRHVSCIGGTPPLLSIVTHMDQVQLFLVCILLIVVLAIFNLQHNCLPFLVSTLLIVYLFLSASLYFSKRGAY